MTGPMRVLLVAAPLALALAGAGVSPGARPVAPECTRTSVGLTPLTELGTRRYHGHAGGLYDAGRNTPPRSYLRRGLAAARDVRPRAGNGRPRRTGRIVLLSIGMSNATQEFAAFKALADSDPRKDARVTVVDGAQGGWDAIRVADEGARYWAVVDERLRAAGVTRRQVQAAWLKEAIARPTEQFPADAQRLRSALSRIVAIARSRFPNLRLVYLSSRTYAGYAVTPLNPEPFAYQSGFAVKWTVGDRIAGRLRGPWLGWGPYLWTDGMTARRDGFVWACEDVGPDGTHPSASGRRKVAERLLAFFVSDPTARKWFRR
jgi:hypothetical protein